MQINSPSLFGAALPVEPSKPIPNTPAPANPAQPNFAQMLNQRRAAAAPMPPKSTEPVHAASTGRESEPAPQQTSAAKPRPAEKAPARPTAKAPADKPAAAKETDAKTKETAKADGDSDDDTTTATPAEPKLPDWLAALQRPAEAPAGTAGAAPALATPAGDAPADSEGTATAKGGRALRDALAGAKAADTTAGNLLATATTANAPAEAGSFAAALAEHGAAEHRPTDAVAAGGPDPVALAAGLQTAPAERRAEVAAALPLSIAAPPGTSEFREALGVQVSVLAKDGVERAELHLNPADMGPVSVHIVMDGTQARVDFGADVAATRHAIEAGLPELAAALRDAGFTLAGGGVSDQSRGRGDEPAKRGDGRSGDAATPAVDAAAAAPVRRTVTLGGLDLYA